MSGSVGQVSLRLSAGLSRSRRGSVLNRCRAVTRRFAGREVGWLSAAPFFLGERGTNGENRNRERGDGSFHILLILIQNGRFAMVDAKKERPHS